MTAQTWNSLKQTLLIALSQATAPYTIVPADFTNLMPQATSYAENRIYRDIPMLAQRQQGTVSGLIAGESSVAAPRIGGSAPVTIERFAIVVAGVNYWYDRTTADVIGLLWPDSTTRSDPQNAEWLGRYWAPFSDSVDGSINVVNPIVTFCPPLASGGLSAFFIGLYPPAPISISNQTTYLSSIYPDLLEMACLVFLSGALKNNFGQLAVTPQEAVTWETQYQALMESAKQEEMRRRGLLPAIPLPSRPAAPAGVPGR